VPAGPTEAPRPPWTDYPSFRTYVLAECLRLGAPAPDDRQLGDLYIERRITLAHMDAADEVARFNAARADGLRPARAGGRR
jgi:hypothetical protein